MTHAADHSPRRTIATLYGIFFVSGFCGLIYESIWSHYLKLLLGHAAYAQAVVLVVFVGGLALGAWLTGRWSERLRNPLLLYAAAEVAVALASYSFHNIFIKASAWAVQDFMPAFCPATGPCPATWLLAALLILPASVLLGTTFPLMSAGVLRLGVNAGRGLSLLYFLNSAGAALGVLCSGFLLIPALGLQGTMLLAGTMNALVGLTAYLVVRRREAPPPPPEPAAAAAAAAGLKPLLAVALLTGFSSFIYEVVWIRMLTLVMGAATHSFELMLATFILGLALGAWWIRNRIDGSPRPEILLANVQIIMGLCAIATLPLYAGSFEGMAYALRGLARTDEAYLFFNLGSGLLAAAVMMPAAFCAGMTLPLITALLLRRGLGERQIGQVYGVNTLGAIAGVLAAVHVLMPLLGLKWSLAVAALVDVAIGLYLYRRVRAGTPEAAAARPSRWLVAAGAASVATVVAVPLFSHLAPQALASGVFRSGQPRTLSDQQVIFQRDGRTASVSVLERRSGERSLLTNGKPDGTTHPHGKVITPDDHTVVLLGALGPLHHPAARRAAVIGLGTGVTSSVLLGARGIESVDTIEIEPLMLEAAQLFRPRSAPVFDDPRSHVVIDDARAHFARTPARYDLVVSEPSNPWVSGVSGLFTQEFYRYVSGHLAPEGHFVQWLHLYEASPAMVGSIIGAFSSVFPQFRVYAANSADIVLVARNDGRLPAIAGGTLDRMPGLHPWLGGIGIESEAMLAAHEAGPAAVIRAVLASYGSPINSDYFPFVDHEASRDRFQSKDATYLFDLNSAPLPLLELRGAAPAYLGRISSSSPYMPFKLHDLAGAWHGHRYLRGETLTRQEAAYLGTLLPDYALTRSWLADCRLPPDDDPLWNVAVKVASSLNRGLEPQIAGKFWTDAAARCARNLTPAKAAWLALFAATAQRDPASMRTWADKVLATDQNLTAVSREYATLAAVGSRLMLDDAAGAREVFLTQGRALPADRFERPWFRYVALELRASEIAAPRTAPATPRNGAQAKE